MPLVLIFFAIEFVILLNIISTARDFKSYKSIRNHHTIVHTIHNHHQREEHNQDTCDSDKLELDSYVECQRDIDDNMIYTCRECQRDIDGKMIYTLHESSKSILMGTWCINYIFVCLTLMHNLMNINIKVGL